MWVKLIDNRKEPRIKKIMLNGKAIANRELRDVDNVVNPAVNVYKVNAKLYLSIRCFLYRF
jgi:uncharacterized UPF0146 family protein